MASQSRKDLEEQLTAHLERLQLEEALELEDGDSKVVDQWQEVTPFRGRRAAWKHHGG